MSESLLTLPVRREADVVQAHQRVRQLAIQLGFERVEQTRISTALSEVARNALVHGGSGQVDVFVDESALILRISDSGPGIGRLGDVLAGRHRSQKVPGLGLGLSGARRLMDDLRIDTSEAGTVVTMEKRLPRRGKPMTTTRIREITAEAARPAEDSPYTEIRRLNQELLQRDTALAALTREMEDTNRGVMALYAELEERAEYQRRASELKTRLLADMGHEIRTPLHSILKISLFLLQHLDGDLNGEQEQQVRLIHETADDLSEFVDDLLDIARAEAGKVPVRPSEFAVTRLFGALRGLLRPLVRDPAVELVFADAAAIPPLYTDEAKVTQVLRNFISNALKFTERGRIEVRAAVGPGDTVVLSVSDTGVGIAIEDHERVFTEFTQIDGPVERRYSYRGSGLGLPLTRRLALLLGGEVQIQSRLGEGSTFSLVLPRRFTGEASPPLPATAAPPLRPRTAEPARTPRQVLIIDDDEASRYVLRRHIAPGHLVRETARGQEGLRLALEALPDVIFLDLSLPDTNGFTVLDTLRADPRTRAVPVVIYTAHALGDEERERLQGAVAIVRKASASRSGDQASLEAALREVGLLMEVRGA